MSNGMNGWMLAGGAAAITLAASCFGYLRAIYQQIIGRVLVTISVSGYQADAVIMYLRQQYNMSRFGPRSYIGWKLFFQPSRRVQLMPMEVATPTGQLFWKGLCLIWIGKSKTANTDLETGVNARDYNDNSLDILFARGTLDPDRFILEATAFYNEQTQVYDATEGRRHSVRYVHGTAGSNGSESLMNQMMPRRGPTSMTDIRGCLVNRPLGFRFSELGMGSSAQRTALDQLALCESAEQLVTEVKRWRESEDWHLERQLPWRRGYMLYGPPGSGKTALARAIAEDLDLPVYVYNLASLKNDELQRAWNQMLEEVPCVAMFEDIDAVFHGRRNVAVASGPSLTFDCLLNCLDGVQRANGLLTFMTTNHLELVDPAIGQPGEIGSRPGRIDRVVKLAMLDDAGRRKIAKRILSNIPELIAQVCSLGQHDTPAQFQERCGRIALAHHYGDVIDLTEKPVDAPVCTIGSSETVSHPSDDCPVTEEPLDEMVRVQRIDELETADESCTCCAG